MDTLLIIIAALSIITFVVSSMVMVDYISRRGEKVNWVWIRLFIFSYVNKYRELTKKSSGKTGKLFYIWITSINIALVSVIILSTINL